MDWKLEKLSQQIKVKKRPPVDSRVNRIVSLVPDIANLKDEIKRRRIHSCMFTAHTRKEIDFLSNMKKQNYCDKHNVPGSSASWT
jgi:hypothetical protein